MAFYRVNLYQTLDIEAENKEEAEDKALEMAKDYIAENAETVAKLCGNCSREIDENENRCERCKNL
ncbi:MAG: hypothetical protein AABY22_18890 [Nanoarchaeota archaeon]